jgi:hypothetical protein
MATDPNAATERPYFKTKAEWAASRAKELRDQAYKIRFTSSNGQAWRARRKFESVDRLYEEAARFDQMAATYRRKGL